MKKFFNKKDINFYNIQYNKRNKIFNILGFNKKKKSFILKQEHVHILQNRLRTLKKKKDKEKKYHFFAYKIKTYKSFRNLLGYPSRGQRTHTNAKTKKKKKIIIKK